MNKKKAVFPESWLLWVRLYFDHCYYVSAAVIFFFYPIWHGAQKQSGLGELLTLNWQ